MSIIFALQANCPFKEAAILLNSSYPRLQPSVLKKQLDGKTWGYPADSDVEKAAADLPVWNRYFLYQDSADHYESVSRQSRSVVCLVPQKETCAWSMEVCGEDGGILLGIRDFWQKYPSGLEVTNLADDKSHHARHGFIRQRPKALIFVIMIREATR